MNLGRCSTNLAWVSGLVLIALAGSLARPLTWGETVGNREVIELEYLGAGGRMLRAVPSLPSRQGPFPLVVTIHGANQEKSYAYLRTMAAPTVALLNEQPWAVFAHLLRGVLRLGGAGRCGRHPLREDSASSCPHGFYWGREVSAARAGPKTKTQRGEEDEARQQILRFFARMFGAPQSPPCLSTKVLGGKSLFLVLRGRIGGGSPSFCEDRQAAARGPTWSWLPGVKSSFLGSRARVMPSSPWPCQRGVACARDLLIIVQRRGPILGVPGAQAEVGASCVRNPRKPDPEAAPRSARRQQK